MITCIDCGKKEDRYRQAKRCIACSEKAVRRAVNEKAWAKLAPVYCPCCHTELPLRFRVVLREQPREEE